MSRLLATWIDIYREVKDLGIGFSLARLADRKGGGEAQVRVGRFGAVTIRRGDSDLATLRQVFLNHEYALPWAVRDRVQARYEAILAAGKTPIVVDAGANIGAASIWFKQLYPRAAVVAIEPQPDNAALIRRNVAPWDDVIVLEAAIGSEAGFVSVIGNGESWGFQTARADTGQPIVTVPAAAAKVADGALFIVKVDIEGFENDLFADNLGWLDEAYVVFIEPHDWMLPGRRTSGSFQRAMASRDFELFMVGENLAYVRI